MTHLALKVLSGVDTTNQFYGKLKENIELKNVSCLSEVQPEDFVVVDAKSVIGKEGDSYKQLCAKLGEGTSVLFLDADADCRKMLGKYLGFNKEGESVALFVKPHGKNAKKYSIFDLSNSKPTKVKSQMISSKSDKIIENDFELKTDSKVISKNVMDMFYGDIMEGHINAAEDNDIPPDVEYKQWVYGIYYDWSSSERDKWKSYTPRDQDTYGRVTYIVQAFKDVAVTGDFQWIYMDCNGMWCTSKTGAGMNENNHDERGWSIGSIEISIPTPSDNGVNLKVYDCSPKNINGVKSYTSSVSFEVGYDTGSFSYSESCTEDITDWSVTLKTDNDWLFQQNSPYPGSIEDFPDDSIDYNAGKARHEIKSLPTLSTTAVDFDTKSVWFNNSVSTNTIYIRPDLTVKYNYEALKNEWPTWEAMFWWNYHYGTESFSIDLSQVS